MLWDHFKKQAGVRVRRKKNAGPQSPHSPRICKVKSKNYVLKGDSVTQNVRRLRLLSFTLEDTMMCSNISLIRFTDFITVIYCNIAIQKR